MNLPGPAPGAVLVEVVPVDVVLVEVVLVRVVLVGVVFVGVVPVVVEEMLAALVAEVVELPEEPHAARPKQASAIGSAPARSGLRM
ncbi:MAG: hypothetical protein ACHQDY_09010 [Solirubrobacterales bacterium]